MTLPIRFHKRTDTTKLLNVRYNLTINKITNKVRDIWSQEAKGPMRLSEIINRRYTSNRFQEK